MHSKMLQAGTSPDRITYTILIQISSARYKLQEACKLLKEGMDSNSKQGYLHISHIWVLQSWTHERGL